MEMIKRIVIFNVEENLVVRWLEDFFSDQWDCWIWWSEFVFLVILSEVIVQ
jgi:hypothetical protein